MSISILQGDCRDILRALPAESVHTVVTSPPYWGLRDYGVAGSIGLEDSFEVWLREIVGVFQEARRVLRSDGTAWINLGDCYAGGNRGGGNKQSSNKGSLLGGIALTAFGNLKAKDLVGMPWRVAFALRDDGWWLRRDIIWHKPNAMPESIDDRPATAHEYIFLLTKSARYAYDAIAVREPTTGNAHARGDGVNAKIKVPGGWDTGSGGHGSFHREGRGKPEYRPRQNASFSAAVNEVVDTKNKRSVWTVPTEGFSEAHFATFPPALIEPCILAGCPKGGVVLDPFAGAGTTGLVADRLGRNAILIELNPEYAAMAERRIRSDAGMFAEISR